MNTTDELVIKSSKNKMIFIVVGSCVFVAVGAWLLSLNNEAFRTGLGPLARNPLFVRAVAVTAIVFFGFFGIFAVKKLFHKKPGLVLNSAGIIDNTSAFSAGLIPWSDIVGAEEHVLPRNKKMLVIKLVNPEIYIERGGRLRRMINRMNYKMCGSPVALTAGTLKISFPELVSTVERYHQKFGQSMKASV